jgi:exodeoxyribonuclease V alpha subunit
METIIGTVHRILWFSPDKDNSYKVFILKKNNGRLETVTGEFPEIVEGVSMEVHGDYKDHPKYGRGFKAKAHSFTYDKKSNVSIALYLQSIARFVGPVKSQDIANYFGEELENIIEKQPERLCEVPNIGEKIAANIVTAWNEHREEKSVRIFLHSLGLSEILIKKILLSFGLDAETKIRENPFLLAIAGFGFSTCDFIAGKLNIDPSSPLRYRHFVLWALKEAANSGHLFLYDTQIVNLINIYNQNTHFRFKGSKEIILDDLKVHLEYLEKEGYIIKNGDNKYYELNLFFIENESAKIISLIATRSDNIDLSHINVEVYIKDYEISQQDPTKPEPFVLSEEQRDAIRSFVKEKILVITGSPGTGKTTIVKSFVQLMMQNNIRFELLTPTGIASKKLGVTAGYEAYTIHRRLGYRGNSWDYGPYNKYDTDVVIVDEMSMVDMEVFYRLVSALYPHTKLVFVGDNDQLPSVGPGRVLNELIQSGEIKTISLKNIFRQAEKSDIIKEAKKIKEGDVDLSLFKGDPKADIFFLRSSSTKEIERVIMKYAHGLKEKIKNSGEKKTFQIITPRNSGPLSVQTLNTALQESLNPKVEGEREITLNHCVIRKGDRVLIKKNNYDLGVFNGDIGKVKRLLATDIEVELDDYEGVRDVCIPLEIAEDHLKLAFSITVHKSQGMEYDLIILPLVKLHGKRILQRNLLYTAITRAKKKVIVIGQASAIVDAIENDKIQDRNTLLAERIRLWTKKEGTSLQQLYSNPNNFQNAQSLKQLLLLEEKASEESESATIETFPKKTSDPAYQPSRPSRSSKPYLTVDGEIEKLLKELDQKIDMITPTDLEKEELPF